MSDIEPSYKQRHTTEWLALAVVTLAGFALRSWRIDSAALWGDEALTILIAEWPTHILFLYPADPTPGLYYFAHKVLIGATDSAATARTISLVAGTLLIPVMFLQARASGVSGLLAATLTALSYPLIDYSQEARAYSLLLLWIALSGYAFVSWHGSRSLRALLACNIANLLALYTHFVAIFWVLPVIAAMILWEWRSPRRKTAFRITIYSTVLLAIPEVSRVLAYPKTSFVWLEQFNPVDAISWTGSVLLPLGIVERGIEYQLPPYTFLISLTVFFLLALAALKLRVHLRAWVRLNPAAAFVIATSLVAPLALWLFGYAAKPILMPRTLLIAVPGFLLAVTVICHMTNSVVGLVAVLLYAISLAITGTVRPKPDWRTAADRVANGIHSGDVVSVCPGWQAAAFRHAFRGRTETPLVAVFPHGPVVLEPRLGTSPDWVSGYFKGYYGRPDIVQGQATLSRAKRVWRIETGCGSTNRESGRS